MTDTPTPQVVYYSAPSGNTRRFVERLGVPAARIHGDECEELSGLTDGPFALIVPTYDGRVPAPVVRFLNREENRRRLVAVVGSGSTNFGPEYGVAGKVVSHKCGVPLLHTFELSGLPEDIALTRQKLDDVWTTLPRRTTSGSTAS